MVVSVDVDGLIVTITKYDGHFAWGLIPCKQPGERHVRRKLDGKKFVDHAPDSKHLFIEGGVCTDVAELCSRSGRLVKRSTKNVIHRSFSCIYCVNELISDWAALGAAIAHRFAMHFRDGLNVSCLRAESL